MKRNSVFFLLYEAKRAKGECKAAVGPLGCPLAPL